MSDPLDGPDAVISDDLDRIVRTRRGDLNSLSGASLLLTGATGFVGRYLVETVIRSNEVSGSPPCVLTLPTRRPDLLASRYPAQVAAGEIELVEWGAGHAIDLPGRRWDYIIHGAATTDPAQFRTDPSGSLRDTIAMAASVAAVARVSAARRVVLISSGAVYGDQPVGMAGLPETYEAGPAVAAAPGTEVVAAVAEVVGGYAEAKRESERRFRATDVDLRIARIFSLVGPYQDLGSAFAVPDLIRQAAAGGPISLTTDGSARRSFCYASDLDAILFWLLLGEPRREVYNVGNREATVSIAEVARTIAAIFGGLEVRPSADAGSQRDYVPSLDRLYEEMVPAVVLREGLLRTCHSLYARGVISRRPAVELD